MGVALSCLGIKDLHAADGAAAEAVVAEVAAATVETAVMVATVVTAVIAMGGRVGTRRLGVPCRGKSPMTRPPASWWTT